MTMKLNLLPALQLIAALSAVVGIILLLDWIYKL